MNKSQMERVINIANNIQLGSAASPGAKTVANMILLNCKNEEFNGIQMQMEKLKPFCGGSGETLLEKILFFIIKTVFFRPICIQDQFWMITHILF